MFTFVWILCFIATLSLLAYMRAALWIWTLSLAVFLVLVAQWSTLSVPSQVILWILYVSIALLLHIHPLRRTVMTRHLLHLYQKVKPALSTTEKEALAIGTVGWEGELFSGKPNWSVLKGYSAARFTEEERCFLEEDTEELCRMLDNWEINHHQRDLPETVWNFLKTRGFFSLIIPKQYGGKQFSAQAHSAVIMKIAGRSNAAATVVGVPNSLGPAELLLEYGTEAQKTHYLPRLARGEDIPCFALTGPDAGSDASSMTDCGIVCKGQWEGKEIIGIQLRWDKRYITLAPVATLLGLAFKLFDPEHLLGAQEDIGITCALIPTSTPGVIIGRRHVPLCSAFPNGPTQGKDVFIPLDYIIGGPEMAGKGWHMLIERLSVGRAITLPSLSTGGAKVAAFVTGAYARIRRQFHISVGKFEGVEEALTRIAGHTYIMDAMRLLGVAAVDKGECPAIPSAMSKYHTTELARQVINDAMDVHGGKGICMGPRNYLAQTYIEAPIAITVEGANILTRCMIIFGQGIMRCHPYLLKELIASQDPDPTRALQDFDNALFKHLGLLISNKSRAFLLALTQGRMACDIPKTHPALKRYYQQILRFSAAFAYAADVAVLTLGGALKRSEHLSGRLGDVFSMLYMLSAVLKHFEDQGSHPEEVPVVEWACQTLLFKLQTAFDAALRNFPKPYIGTLLRCVLFPLGCRFKPPSDLLGHEVSVLLSGATQMRSRLTAGIYATPDAENGVGQIGAVLIQVMQAEKIEKKIQHAVFEKMITARNPVEKIAQAVARGIITEEEKAFLEETEAARREISAVDDFASEALRTR